MDTIQSYQKGGNMKWKTQDQYRWKKVFLFLPEDINGTTYWLCYVEKRLASRIGGRIVYEYRLCPMLDQKPFWRLAFFGACELVLIYIVFRWLFL